ncbi:MAG: CocE/NonD family hydrolase [Bacteriovoracaceae bacterium]|nr:CocE/NonD family hydrolase [Bacteriovoracaceae bacterium]
MEYIDKFPHSIKHIENTWIPMKDGIRLAARIWMPEDAKSSPVPAILEYIPYRKRDGVRLRDEIMHPYIAGHGYACIRVDIRGSGDSEGVLEDEYLQEELDDGVEIINWLSKQPWCDGNVGMIGISWGGFNGLQIAYMQPPQLKAVISLCSTDDRYADDVHYMGGCLLGDNLSWASTMFAYNSLPPDPEIVGNQWRSMWKQRLEANKLWLAKWLTHQHRDEYWRHGSICEDFSKIKTPVMAVSGWADGYSNAVFRLLENLDVPRLGLIGPWSHMYPHLGVPGPAIGFLQECLRWWDKWLKGQETGIMKEPMLRVWMLDSMPPSTFYHQRFGRWVCEQSWPPPNPENLVLKFQEFQLVSENKTPTEHVVTLQSPLSNGLLAGKWCSYSATPDLPHDQREEDGGAVVFNSSPLDQTIEILGAPEVELEVSANRPVAMLAVRLSDMRLDNKVTRVTYGLLNLTHRDGHESPSELEPGKFYKVKIQLNGIAQTFPKGHRIRVAISSSYFPLAWPAPESAQIKIKTRSCRLSLPLHTSEDEKISFSRVEGATPGVKVQKTEPHHNWFVKRDLDQDRAMLEVIDDQGKFILEDIKTKVIRKCEERYSYQGDDFQSPKGETIWERGLERGDWSVRTITRTVLSCDEQYFYLTAQLDAYEKEIRVFSKNFNKKVKRRLV